MTPLNIGDHVRVIPNEHVEARVIGLQYDVEGWTVTCRWFQYGEAREAKLFLDEIEQVKPAAYAFTNKWVLPPWPEIP